MKTISIEVNVPDNFDQDGDDGIELLEIAQAWANANCDWGP